MIGIVFVSPAVTVVALGWRFARKKHWKRLKKSGDKRGQHLSRAGFVDDWIESIRTLVPADANALASKGLSIAQPEVSAS